MNAREQYDRWCAQKLDDAELTAQLQSIAGDEKEIYERFYTDLAFGTAGLRGILGAGTNRMNVYTVRRASQGLACCIKSKEHFPTAAIAYDSRNKSRLFAEAASSVLAANGVRVYLYPTLAPTPMLSWAVRYYGCAAGIVITASHNPAEYNGYKVYGSDGCQMTSETANEVLSIINGLDLFEDVLTLPFEEAVKSGMVIDVADCCVQGYYGRVLGCRLLPGLPAKADLSVAYTPLCGTGNIPVRHILEAAGVKKLWVVPAQQEPDGNFTTCRTPNPEMPAAMELGLALAEREGADLLLGTDPDADRVGAAVRHNGTYTLLTGNEVGVLLTDYIGRVRTESGSMPEHPVLVKSIVTTALADLVAASYGLETVNVLTGFKYIGEQIALLEQRGEESRFVFGFEESCGYLPGTYVRDKDAVSACLLIAEAASYHKLAGRTLVDALNDIYARFGYFFNTVESTAFFGADGMSRLAALMDDLFAAPPERLGIHCVVETRDYRARVRVRGEDRTAIDLPRAEVLTLVTDDGSTVVIRPSGTEPKLKVYYMVRGKTMGEAQERAMELSAAVSALPGLE